VDHAALREAGRVALARREHLRGRMALVFES
jgi:hypothetical protein